MGGVSHKSARLVGTLLDSEIWERAGQAPDQPFHISASRPYAPKMARRGMVFSWFKFHERGRREKVRFDRKHVEARARRFLKAYLAADEFAAAPSPVKSGPGRFGNRYDLSEN
jgi:hypothetical protein